MHCADLIASRARHRQPQITIAPSLLGEVTHYVADLSKARELLGYAPKVPLDEGIARSVAWFLEHRAAHPEEDVSILADHEGALGQRRDRLEVRNSALTGDPERRSQRG